MRTKLTLLWVLVVSAVSLFSQTDFTLHIYYAQNQPIQNELYGVHMSGFFDRCRCYDPDSVGGGVDSINQCMEYAAALQPRVLRFPTGGENKFVKLLDGPPGYGYEQPLIDSAYARGYLDASGYADWTNTVTNQYLINPDSARYIDRLIDFVQYCDEVNGFAPSVIFVANVSKQAMFPDIYDNVTDENLAAINYLVDNGINIAAIEMGSEHYDDGNDIDTFATFDKYYELIKPLLIALQSDPVLNSIPVSVVAAPEPEFAEFIGVGPGSVDHYKEWNSQLRDRAEITTRFDCYSIHLYDTDKAMEPCYQQYNNLYSSLSPNYDIPFAPLPADDTLSIIWGCARDSFYSFTNNYLPTIFNRYSANDSSYCLGTVKSYVLSEWGVKPPDNPGSGVPITDSTLLGNFNNTFAEAGFTFMYLLTLADIDTLDMGANIAMATKHTEMAGYTYGLVSFWSSLDVDDPDQRFVKRASWYPYYLMKNIFNKNYERVKSDVVLLDGTYTPFIKTYFGGDGAYMGTGWAPYFHMFYYNPTADTLYCIRDSITADIAFGYGDEDPLNGHMRYRYMKAGELYSHGGDNSYMRDNGFYTGASVAPLIDTIYEGSSPAGSNPALLPYSMGEFYWRLIPLPYKEESELIAGDIEINVYPNPASDYVNFNVDLRDEYVNEYIISIYNMFGQKINELLVSNDNAVWQPQDLSKGVYIYELTSMGKRLGTGKIILQ